MFDVRKATQVAAYFLWKSERKMPYLKLMKMIYLAEKQFVLQYDEQLTGDQVVSSPQGPMLSSMYECVFGGNDYWNNWINNPGQHALMFNGAIAVDRNMPLNTFDELTEAELSCIDSVFEKYGQMDQAKLVELSKNPRFCPECEDTWDSLYPIAYRSMLMKNGKTEEQADAILERVKEVDDVYALALKLA